MAPLLFSHFRARHRSVLTSLFTATFLGAVVVVAMPCPARDSKAMLQDEAATPASTKAPKSSEVIVMMNQRGRRRFLEE